MPNPNGEVKKFRPQTAVIRIVERPDGRFDASLQFEPSILNKRTRRVSKEKEDNIAVRVAHFCWNRLKEQQKGQIIITD